MSNTQCTSRSFPAAAPKNRTTGPTRSVPDMLLELAYRLHATRVVKVLPRPVGNAQASARGE